MSIILYSEAGLTLVNMPYKITLSDNSKAYSPVIGLFPKSIPMQNAKLSWKNTRITEQPCLYSTGYSINAITKLCILLLNKPQIMQGLSIPKELVNDLALIAKLQLEYCLENIGKSHIPLKTLNILIEGCLHSIELNHIYKEELDTNIINKTSTLLHRISNSVNWDSLSTLELCAILKSLTLYYKHSYISPQNSLLNEIALEIIHRQNKLGLTYQNSYNGVTLPLSSQFYIIDCLLATYPYGKFNIIYEQAFAIFNTLYQLSWNPISDYFTLQYNSRVQYTAFDIGAIISSLYRIIHWIEADEQQELLRKILTQSYLKLLINSCGTSYEHEYQTLIEDFKCPNIINTKQYRKNKNATRQPAPVFPSSLIVKLNDRRIYRRYNSLIQLWQPLYLCSCLLDLLETE